MTSYGICTFAVTDGSACAGISVAGKVVSIDELIDALPGSDWDALRGRSVFDFLQEWSEVKEVISGLVNAAVKKDLIAECGRASESVKMFPPIMKPQQIFCTGANYRQHVIDLTLDAGVGPEGLSDAELRTWAENMMDERAANGEPYVFMKPVSAMAGAYDSLPLPSNTTQPDWELELGVVIGKEAFRVSREDALSYVAGYTIVNDISARDLIPRTDYKMLGTDWFRSKGQRGFFIVGPEVVPSEFVEDPMDLKIKLEVSGKLMQNETTADMIFDIARQIEYISSYTPLLPGDIICTGSPAGNGTHYNRFLRDGDIMTGEIEGLGVQKVHCVADHD